MEFEAALAAPLNFLSSMPTTKHFQAMRQKLKEACVTSQEQHAGMHATTILAKGRREVSPALPNTKAGL